MSQFDITVAGHLCLDIIPQLLDGTTDQNVCCPGTLRTVGPAMLSTGGVVSNTGIALHQLGFRVQLMGKVGDDPLGGTVLEILRKKDPNLTSGMIIAPGQNTSYTVVLNPPGIDRAFLHCPGVNDVFTADELDIDQIALGRILHFGYPPLMRGVYSDQGRGLAKKMAQIQDRGLLTSLDMANPDPLGESGKINWRDFLQTVLPTVDIFLPSFDEMMFILNRERYVQLCEKYVNPATASNLEEISSVARQLLEFGTKIVVLKLGDQGVYVQTADDLSGLQLRSQWTNFDVRAWSGVKMYSPCYDVPVVGTTGSGDATIAGFLGAMLKGLSPQMALDFAAAVGACSVQSADATSGIPTWNNVSNFVKHGEKKKMRLSAIN